MKFAAVISVVGISDEQRQFAIIRRGPLVNAIAYRILGRSAAYPGLKGNSSVSLIPPMEVPPGVTSTPWWLDSEAAQNEMEGNYRKTQQSGNRRIKVNIPRRPMALRMTSEAIHPLRATCAFAAAIQLVPKGSHWRAGRGTQLIQFSTPWQRIDAIGIYRVFEFRLLTSTSTSTSTSTILNQK